MLVNLVVAERVAKDLNGAKEDSLNDKVTFEPRSNEKVATVSGGYL